MWNKSEKKERDATKIEMTRGFLLLSLWGDAAEDEWWSLRKFDTCTNKRKEKERKRTKNKLK